jgi:TP901 family phage tail tape measure protein
MAEANRKLSIEVAVVDQASKVLDKIAEKIESLDLSSKKAGSVPLGVTLKPPTKAELTKILAEVKKQVDVTGKGLPLFVRVELRKSSLQDTQKALDYYYNLLKARAKVLVPVELDLTSLRSQAGAGDFGSNIKALGEIGQQLKSLGQSLTAGLGDLGTARLSKRLDSAQADFAKIREISAQGVTVAQNLGALNRQLESLSKFQFESSFNLGQISQSATSLREGIAQLKLALAEFEAINTATFKDVGAKTKQLTDSIRYIRNAVASGDKAQISKTVEFFRFAAQELNKIPPPEVKADTVRGYRAAAAALGAASKAISQIEFAQGNRGRLEQLTKLLRQFGQEFKGIPDLKGGPSKISGYTSTVNAMVRFNEAAKGIQGAAQAQKNIAEVRESIRAIAGTLSKVQISKASLDGVRKVTTFLGRFSKVMLGVDANGARNRAIQIGGALDELVKSVAKVQNLSGTAGNLEQVGKSVGALGRGFLKFQSVEAKIGGTVQSFKQLGEVLKTFGPIASSVAPQLAEMADALRKTNRALATMDRRMETLPENARQFAGSMSRAASGVARFEEDSTKAAENLGLLSKALKIVERDAQKTKKGLLSFLAGLAGYNRGVIKLRDGLTVISRSFGLNAVGITGIGLALRKGVTDFLAYSRALNDVRTIMDETTLSFAQADRNVRRVAISLGLSEIDVAAGLYQTLSAGVTDTAQAMIVLEGAAGLAVAGSATVAETVDLLTTTINAFNVDVTADSVENLNDILFETVRLAKTTVPELARSIGQIAPFAAQAEISLEETVGALAALTLGGKKTSQAVVQLRQQFVTYFKAQEKSKNAVLEINAVAGEQIIQFDSLALKTKGLVGTLRELRTATGGNVDTIALLFPNIRALGSVLDLAGNQFERFKRITDEVTNSQGKFREALQKQLAGPAKRVDIITTGLRLGLSGLGEQFVKGFFQVDEFGKSLQEVQSQAIDLDDQIRQFGDTVKGLGAILRSAGELALSMAADFNLTGKITAAADQNIRLLRTSTAAAELATARAAIAQERYNQTVGKFDPRVIVEAQIARKLLEGSKSALELTAAAENATNAIFDLGFAAKELAIPDVRDAATESYFKRQIDAQEKLEEGPLRVRAGFIQLASEIRNSADQVDAVQLAFEKLDLAARQIIQKSTPEGLEAISEKLNLNTASAEALSRALRQGLTEELGRGSKNAAATVAQLVELQRKADTLFRGSAANIEKYTPVIRKDFVDLLKGAFEGGIPLPREATENLIDQIFSPSAAKAVREKFAEVFQFDVVTSPEVQERITQQAIGVIDETIRALRSQGKVVQFEVEFLEGVDRLTAEQATALFDRRAAEIQNETLARLAELEKAQKRQQISPEERKRGEVAVREEAARAAVELLRQQEIILEGIRSRESSEQRVRDQVRAVNRALRDSVDISLRLADPAGKTADEFERAKANAEAFNELQLSRLRTEDRAVAEAAQRLLIAEQLIAAEQSAGEISRDTADLRRRAVNAIYQRELELAELQRERAREERRLASQISLQELQDELRNTFQAQISGVEQWAATAKFEAREVGLTIREELSRSIPVVGAGLYVAAAASLEEYLALIDKVAERRRDLIRLEREEADRQRGVDILLTQARLQDELTGGIRAQRAEIISTIEAQKARLEISLAQGQIDRQNYNATIALLQQVRDRRLENLQLEEAGIRLAFEAQERQREWEARLLSDSNLERAAGFYQTLGAAGEDFFDGFQVGFEKLIQQVDTFGQLGERVFGAFTNAFTEYIGLLIDGKTSFSEFANQFLAEVAKMIAQMTILAALKAFVAGFTGGADTAAGSGFGADIAFDDAAPIYDTFARGGIMKGAMLGTLPVKNYAAGGVANSPQMAIFGEGNNRRYGEAFVPLGPSRKIPVEVKAPMGDGGGSKTAVVNLNVQSLDPKTAADTILANMPKIRDQIASALVSGQDRNLVNAVRSL